MNTDNRITRRTTLAALASLGGAAVFIPAWNETVEAADAVTCVPSTPTVTEGPYWVDEKLFRADIRTDPSTGTARDGVPLNLTIAVQNLTGGNCTPLVGAYIDIWHCDAKGIYSDEPTYNPGGGTGNVNTSGQKFLRGYQITDANGQVQFLTIYPGWYSGRTIHIHVRVRTYSGATVLGNFVSQIFFDDAVNDTVLAQTAYARSTARDTTNARDMVYQVANKERMLATVNGSVVSGYTATIAMGATLTTAAASAPALVSGGVSNALSGAAGVAPGSWISIYGTNLADTARSATSSDLINGAFPTTLAGVSVRIDGKAAYVQYVSANQINVLAPADTATGSVAVTITNAAGSSNSITATMLSVLPGLATVANYVRAIRYPDSVIINGTGAAETGFNTSAAAGPGDVIAIFGTGFGPTDPVVETGLVFTGAYQLTNPVSVSIGGIPAEVLWAGLSAAGLDQINLRIPATIADGDHPIIATIAGVSTQSTALLKIAAGSALKTQNVFNPVLRRSPSRARPFLPLDARRASMDDFARVSGLLGPETRAGAPRHERHRVA